MEKTVDKESSKENLLDYYQGVSNALGKELEQILNPDKIKNQGRVLSKDDVEILSMAKDFFYEFLEDFKDKISSEHAKKIYSLNNLISKIVDIEHAR